MTKSEARAARKAGTHQHVAGVCTMLVCDRVVEREQATRREVARLDRMDRWARRYDDLNGAPESDGDR